MNIMIDPVVNQIENQCDQIWRNATSLVNILKYLAIYLRLIWFWAKFLTLFGTILYAFGQIFIAVSGQILRTQSGHLVTLLSSLTHPVRPRNPPLLPREAKALHRLDRVKQRTLSYFIRGSMNVCLTSWSWFKLLCL